MRTDASAEPGSSVLIVDPSADCREVLSTLLQRRGVRTWETAKVREGLDLMRLHHPDVVVLDVDGEIADDDKLRGEYDQQSQRERTSMIFLGVTRRSTRRSPSDHGVAKPYHFAHLLRTIEQLLGR